MFKPSEFAVGGGLLDDVDVLVKQARIVMFDYNGTQPPGPAIQLTLEHSGEDTEQCWSVGKPADWQPSEDGLELVAIGRATQINNQSNGAILLKSIVDAGFPEDKITDKINFLEGLEGHVMRVPSPVRKGLKGREDGKESTILTFASITKLPGGAAAGKKAAPAKAGAKKAPAAPAPAAEAPEGEEESLESVATGILLELIGAAGDAGVKKGELPGKVYAAYGTHPKKKDIVQLLFKDDFLKAGPWTFAGGKLSL